MLKIYLGLQEEIVTQGLEKLRNNKIIQRIWEHDHTIWKQTPKEIENRLGWLEIVNQNKDEQFQSLDILEQILDEGYTHALLPSMGGSSLAPEVFSRVFSNGKGLRYIGCTYHKITTKNHDQFIIINSQPDDTVTPLSETEG